MPVETEVTTTAASLVGSDGTVETGPLDTPYADRAILLTVFPNDVTPVRIEEG